MSRLPYGTFKDLTPEQQKEHSRELSKRFRDNNRERINAKNKEYFDEWKETKPFLCTCKRCNSLFSAPRKTTRVCPNCHKIDSDRVFARQMERINRKRWKTEIMYRVLDLRNQGLLQKEIGEQLGLSQRTVCNILLKADRRSIPKHSRQTKKIDLLLNL